MQSSTQELFYGRIQLTLSSLTRATAFKMLLYVNSNRKSIFPLLTAKVDDIGVVDTSSDDSVATSTSVTMVCEIIGIIHIDYYPSCLACKGRVEVNGSKLLETCTRCNLTMKILRCSPNAVAKVKFFGEVHGMRDLTFFERQNILCTQFSQEQYY